MAKQVDGRRPFLTYLPTNAPHSPLWVPAADREAAEKAFTAGEHQLPRIEEEQRRMIIRFLAMIRNVDTQLGELRRFLAEQETARDTILIFMTDNGSTFGPLYYNTGMRGAKCSLWEGGHRVPCFLHWPGGDVGELEEVKDIGPAAGEGATETDEAGHEDSPRGP